MNELLTLALAGSAGAVLGAIFFGGLWWTVRKGAASPRPALWFLGSLLLRMSLVLAGFYAVGGGHWERLLLCLLGFLAARVIVTRMTRHPERHNPCSTQEARHAPES
jgi:F1F0 ATPase subunit 2